MSKVRFTEYQIIAILKFVTQSTMPTVRLPFQKSAMITEKRNMAVRHHGRKT